MPKTHRRLPCNWRQRVEIVSLPDSFRKKTDPPAYQLQFIKRRTPRGFFRVIGFISIDRDCWVNEVEIDKWARGRGLGLLLYEHVIEKHGSLTTDYHHQISDEAKRVWRSLARKYRHECDFWKGTITVWR